MLDKAKAPAVGHDHDEGRKQCFSTDNLTEAESRDQGRFDWANDPAIVIKRQPAIAIYVNCRDELVIRQEADIGFDSDECVFVRPDHADTLVKAILDAAKPKQRQLRLVEES